MSSQQKKITAHIRGMHCASCEVLIERAFCKVPGVQQVSVNQSRGEAQITCSAMPSCDTLTAAIGEHGYIVTDIREAQQSVPATAKTEAQEKGSYWQAGATILILYALYLLLKQFHLVPEIGVSESMSYGFVFVLGLVAAMSTCMAVTGGLLLALSARHAQLHPNASRWERFRPHLYFNIGRLAGYTLLGAAVGALGSLITISPVVMRLITILASTAMVVLGMKLLYIFPWLTRHVNVRMPKFLAHRIVQAGDEASSTRASFLLGAATFFLPCGFTQALQLYVLSSGSAARGAVTLGVFALGTLPGLLSVGAVSSMIKGRVQRTFLHVSGALVILLGVGNLFGTGGLGLGASAQSPVANASVIGNAQVIDMSVDEYAYTPARFTLKAGVPVTWRIDGRRAAGCAQVIAVRDLGITQLLSRTGITTVQFTPTRAGVFSFSCTMGMAGPGMFIVSN